MSGVSFGAGHLMDIVRGKTTEKVTQYGHEALSTFGIGQDFSELQLRGVLRQLIAMGAVAVDAQAFNTLQLTAESRGVLKGEVAVMLRESVSTPADRKPRRNARLGAVVKAPINLDSEGLLRYSALKAWRAEVAQQHNLPAYVIFMTPPWPRLPNGRRKRLTICRESAVSAPKSWRLTATTCSKSSLCSKPRERSMAVETALVGHRSTRHGVLQALNGTHVARTGGGIRRVGTVLLHQGLEFGLARLQGAGKVQCDVGIVAGMGLAVFTRPVVKQLPLVSSFFRHLNRVFLHICCVISHQ